MKISKTIFKEYTRCPRVCSLDDIYMKRLGTSSIFGADDEKADLIDLLSSMFDVETGDDLVDVIDPQLEALLPYYNNLEKYAMEVATKLFGKNIIYNLETKKQKPFSFQDDFHEYYCYLDGYQELDDIIRIFEVKATTSKKFLELGPKINNQQTSIFTRHNNIIRLDQTSISLDKYQANYDKLFNRYTDVGKYTYDLAIERMIVEKSIEQSSIHKNKKREYYLVVLNSDYVFDGTYDKDMMVYYPDDCGNEIVNFIDLTEITYQYQKQIEDEKNKLIKNINELNAQEVKLGLYCERKKQAKCAFIKTCWKKAMESGSILEYFNNHLGFKDEFGNVYHSLDLLNQGYYKLDSVPREWLHKTNHLIQRDCYDNSVEYINKDKINRGIKAIQYPIYHLDFETFPSPLPRFKGEKPYNQSVFQFSLHVEREMGKCDKETDHFEYLVNDQFDHRLELVQNLIQDIDLSKGGTVLVYNKSFEHTRIKELQNIFPQYKEALQKINEHMFDLLDIVSTHSDFYRHLGFSEEESKEINYYHNELHGSYSIKKVLPLFSSLSYQGMDVANGTEAIATYANFKNMTFDDLQATRQHLLEYCKQDTWAMVVILWGLMKKAGMNI